MNILTPQFRRDSVMQRSLDTGDKSESLRVIVQSDGPGLLESRDRKNHVVAVHLGRPVRMHCRRGIHHHEGTAVHGDIDIVPAGLFASWEMKSTDTALILSLSPVLLKEVAENSNLNPETLELRTRFQIRDTQIEHLAWALKAEAEAGHPSGRTYLDVLATALAMQLLRNHSSAHMPAPIPRHGMSPRVMKKVLLHIEEHLQEDLPLVSMAEIAGLSVSHFKVLFRQGMGVPVHQYVIRRRVERAAQMLRDEDLPISQIALETGFSHQSHLAMHMRRLLGFSPREVRQHSNW